MRIAQISPYSLSVPGGVQGQVLGLARAQRALGQEVVVLAPCDAPPPERGVIPLGRSLSLAANGSVAPVSFHPASWWRTIVALREESFDVLHLHEPLVPGPTLAGLVYGATPTVGTFHRSGTSRAYRAFRPVVQALAARISVRCAVSPEARATAQEALGGTYELLGNGIELDRLVKAPAWPTDAPTVVFVGRHEPRKGLPVLLEAFSTIGMTARLWIIGSGPETAQLRRRFGHVKGVEWLGVLSEDEKASRLAGAHVLAAPSLHGESFGVVLLEAMASGLAIVASDLPAYRRVCTPGEDAVLVPVGDPVALSGALRALLSDTSETERLGTRAASAVASYSMERLAESYLTLYHRLLGW